MIIFFSFPSSGFQTLTEGKLFLVSPNYFPGFFVFLPFSIRFFQVLWFFSYLLNLLPVVQLRQQAALSQAREGGVPENIVSGRKTNPWGKKGKCHLVGLEEVCGELESVVQSTRVRSRKLN